MSRPASVTCDTLPGGMQLSQAPMSAERGSEGESRSGPPAAAAKAPPAPEALR